MDATVPDRDSTAANAGRITVLGIGSVLHSDDGVGVHLLGELGERVPEGVDLVDGGTLSFSLLDAFDGVAGLVVVDAAQLDAAPGTVRVFEGPAMDDFLNRGGAVSVHEVSIAELLDMARLRDGLPDRRAMVAIQPGALDWGDAPSDPVRAAMPVAADAVTGVIEGWQR